MRHTTTSRARQRPVSWKRPDGNLVLLESSHTLPLVDIEIGFRVGSLHDPPGKEGLAALVGRVLKMGPAGVSATRFEEEFARLGARLSVETSPRAMRLRGTVIARNVEPFLEWLARLLQDPGLRSKDFAQAKRQTQAALTSLLDDDGALATGYFRSGLFTGHPFSRPPSGDRSSVRAIRHADAISFYEARLMKADIVFGAAGAISRAKFEQLLERYFVRSRKRRLKPVSVPPPRLDKGRRVVIVDKPNRTQAQLIIGTLSTRTRDPLLFPLIVSNTSFGGTFTARLMQQVRAERGWSYGAYSRLGHEQQRDAWTMWTAPSVDYASECAALQLELLEEWISRGITSEECKFAKRYLINSHCFDIDTAAKRLDAEMEIPLLGLPARHVRDFSGLVRSVTLTQARDATRRRISARDLTIVVVAAASEVASKFEQLPGVTSIEIVPYDR